MLRWLRDGPSFYTYTLIAIIISNVFTEEEQFTSMNSVLTLWFIFSFIISSFLTILIPTFYHHAHYIQTAFFLARSLPYISNLSLVPHSHSSTAPRRWNSSPFIIYHALISLIYLFHQIHFFLFALFLFTLDHLLPPLYLTPFSGRFHSKAAPSMQTHLTSFQPH